ncbi:class I SAM-dependent methyltransferase [Pseudochelatococcus sp. B33]
MTAASDPSTLDHDAQLPDMGRSYDTYFASGLYLSRYPRPNRRTLRLLSGLLPRGGRLLDYGAGEGRYCLSLAQSHAAEAVAVDISAVARDHLSARVRELGLAERVQVCDTGDDTYHAEVSRRGDFDVALLGFGVLGHVPGHEQRLALLTELRKALAPQGRLVLGLPNALRRLRAAQAESASRVASGELEPGDIYYERPSSEGIIPLFYHLFRQPEIRRDLAEAGYVIERLTSESMLPESAITHSPALGVLDDLASSLLPVDWSYGYLAVARAIP